MGHAEAPQPSLHLQSGRGDHVRRFVADGLRCDPAFPVPEQSCLGPDAAARNASGHDQHSALQTHAQFHCTRGRPQPSDISLWVRSWKGLSASEDTTNHLQPASDRPQGLQSRLRQQAKIKGKGKPQQPFDLRRINQQIVSFISTQQDCLELPKYGKAQKKKVSNAQDARCQYTLMTSHSRAWNVGHIST